MVLARISGHAGVVAAALQQPIDPLQQVSRILCGEDALGVDF